VLPRVAAVSAATSTPRATATPRPTATPGTTATPGSSATPWPTATPRPTATPTPAAPSGSATGDAVDYPYGRLQLRATLVRGRLTNVETVQLQPSSGHSQAIDAQALPLLREEALRASGANIDVVSGATYTSEAYARSLQSAIDRVRGA